jgi:hypothetical protein
MTLTRKKFVQWLREQKPGRRFKRDDECGCPMAVFLGAWVQPDHYEKAALNPLPLPLWAKRFVEAVDKGSYDGTKMTITAAECLALLGEKP